MKEKIRYSIFFFIPSLFIFFCSHAQENREQQALTQILNTTEDRFEVTFNYDEDLLRGIDLPPPKSHWSLDEVLHYLETQTFLSFTKTTNKFILISFTGGFSICGYIKDRNSLKALQETLVELGSERAIADEMGFFKIRVTNYSEPIIIKYLGYETVTIALNKFAIKDCSIILLETKLESLSEIVISNYITSGINKLNNGSFKIDFSEFDVLPGVIDNDVLMSIQAFPGIQSTNETVSNINIRGGTHDQNLILWDGIKMYQSGHFFGLISMYNPQITQKVFLRKNGSDASYSDGVSGTIAMQTDSRVNQNLKASVGVNLTDINAFLDAPLGKQASIQIASRKSISDFATTPTYKSFFKRISQNTELSSSEANSGETFDFYDTSMRWLYQISDNDLLQLNFITVHNELQFNENATFEGNQVSRESRLVQNSIAGLLRYSKHWNNVFYTDFELYETDYKLNAINANIEDSQRFLQENKVSETSLKVKGYQKIDDHFNILAGYHFVETEVTNLDDVDLPRYRNLISEVLRTHGIFSQFNFSAPTGNTNLQLGVRYNYISKFKRTLWEPRLSFNQRFLNHFTLEVLGEFKHQNTSQVINFQNDFLGIEKRRWQLSNNEDIPILTSKQISTGITYNYNSWLVSIEGYFKKINGLTAQSQGFQNQFEFSKSTGSYNVRGIDMLLRKQLSQLNTWLSYSYMDNLYNFNTLNNGLFPSNYDITHTVTLGTTLEVKEFKLSTGLNWHSGRPTTQPVEGNEVLDNTINFRAPNSSNLEDYWRFDVSAIYNLSLFKNVKADLGASIWNLFNEKNTINNFYRIDKEDTVMEMRQNSLGITPNAFFRVYF